MLVKKPKQFLRKQKKLESSIKPSNANAIKLQKLFGRDFTKIENDDTLASLKQKTNGLYGKLMSWTTIFPSNKPALSWKQRELHLKKTK